MTTVTDLKKILEILEAHDMGDELVQADHDVIYIPGAEQGTDFAEKLDAAGAFYDESEDWWVVMV
jgi:hypothetical protein